MIYILYNIIEEKENKDLDNSEEMKRIEHITLDFGDIRQHIQ